jgi:predicted metal-dependent HD superfamily phosphohydrolase
MKPVKNLDAEYVRAGEFNVKNRKLIIGLNLVGLATLFLFGWIFFQIASAIRPEIESPALSSVLRGSETLGLLLGLIAVLVIHELVHGFFFWIFTGDRPKFGLHILYAYAAAPGWYLPRNYYLAVGLAPFVCISLVGLLLLPFVPFQIVPVLVLSLIFNAAGSVGDFAVCGWLASQPKTLMVQDYGPNMTYYSLAEPEIAAMSRRWLNLTASLAVDPEQARRVFADLVSCYTASGRYYHNLGHVKELLDTVDELEPLATDFTAIRLAVWFHDVVYDPQAKDNEVKSAEYARKALHTLGLSTEIIDKVSDLILATITHQAPDGDINAQILLDADLAPLAADEAAFKKQSIALRKEFAWLSEEEFQANRARLLGSFLERDRIYQTDELYSSLESQARRNLKKSLSRI